jgi:hypothetical protein
MPEYIALHLIRLLIYRLVMLCSLYRAVVNSLVKNLISVHQHGIARRHEGMSIRAHIINMLRVQ